MYGLLISTSAIASLLFLEKIIKKEGKVSTKDFWGLIIFLIPISIIGGRLYHVFDNWDYYSKFPSQIIQIQNGGMGIYGSLILGFILVYLYSKLKKTNSKIYFDLLLLVTPLVQIAGRLGNYFNKELFGLPTNKPWAVFIPKEYRPIEFREYENFHPLFFYEILLLAILFSYLLDMYLYKKIKVGHGIIVGTYLIGYGSIRIMLEPLRIENAWVLEGFNLTYLFSIAMIMIGLILVGKKAFINFKKTS